MSFFKTNTFYFFLFLIINLIIKALFLDHYSFSYDESISLRNTQLDFGHIKHEAEWDNNPPFYYYCLWVWNSIFPLNEFGVRSFSAILIALGISLNFILVRKNLNYYTAVISTIFLTLSNFLTYHSHEARAYSLVFFLAISSSLLFFNFIRKPGYLNLFFLALINFLLVYTHYISALLIVGQYLYVILFEKRLVVKIYIYQSAFILFLVLLRFTKKQFNNILGFNSSGEFWLKPATFNDLVNSLSEMFFNAPFFVLFLVLALVAFFIKYKYLQNNEKKFLFYCLIVGCFSFLLLFLIGVFKAVFLSRYLIFVIPFVIVFVIHSVSLINYTGRIIAALIIVYPLIHLDLNPIKGNDYRSIVPVIKQNYTLESCVIINTRDNGGLFYYYYDITNFGNLKARDSLMNLNRLYAINDTNELNAANIAKYKKVYLVQTFNKKINNKDLIQEYLKNKYKLVYHTNQFFAAEFSVYYKFR